MCLAGAVEASWSLTKEVAGSSHFTVTCAITNIFEFSENNLGKNSIVRIGFFSILPVQICCRTYATKVKVCSHREFFYILQLYQFFFCFSLSLGVNISLYHIGLFDLLTCISLYNYCRVFSTVNGHRCAGFMNYKFAIDPNAWKHRGPASFYGLWLLLTSDTSVMTLSMTCSVRNN